MEMSFSSSSMWDRKARRSEVFVFFIYDHFCHKPMSLMLLSCWAHYFIFFVNFHYVR